MGGQVNVREPFAARRRVLPRSDARDGVIGQRPPDDALAVEEGGVREEVNLPGNPEVPVLKAALAAVRRQVCGVIRNEVQGYSGTGVCQQRRAVCAEIVQRAVMGIDVESRAREQGSVCLNIIVLSVVVVAVGIGFRR